ncbi:hypothetical protein PIB30_040961 [Stylosanthes scabra]|uniref:Uncharacterized protein n=1 Tax=Stylosanthes scabra TaxID=79078 RepID=A0ABU6SFM0_9FABA|nr:hypothetical protein [Stylosanthes scabra]
MEHLSRNSGKLNLLLSKPILQKPAHNSIVVTVEIKVIEEVVVVHLVEDDFLTPIGLNVNSAPDIVTRFKLASTVLIKISTIQLLISLLNLVHPLQIIITQESFLHNNKIYLSNLVIPIPVPHTSDW